MLILRKPPASAAADGFTTGYQARSYSKFPFENESDIQEWYREYKRGRDARLADIRAGRLAPASFEEHLKAMRSA